jgi:hypothetical protein
MLAADERARYTIEPRPLVSQRCIVRGVPCQVPREQGADRVPRHFVRALPARAVQRHGAAADAAVPTTAPSPRHAQALARSVRMLAIEPPSITDAAGGRSSRPPSTSPTAAAIRPSSACAWRTAARAAARHTRLELVPGLGRPAGCSEVVRRAGAAGDGPACVAGVKGMKDEPRGRCVLKAKVLAQAFEASSAAATRQLSAAQHSTGHGTALHRHGCGATC